MTMPEDRFLQVQSAAVIAGLTDGELEARLKGLAGIERKALSVLLAHLGEFDHRKLHSDRGQPSLFSYCIAVLGYSEQSARPRARLGAIPRSCGAWRRGKRT